MVELRLLGPLEIVGSDGRVIETLARQPKRLALLAYLALGTPSGFHRREKLLALFWPEQDSPHARNALSQALHVIRRALGDDAVVTRGDHEVSIVPDVVRCDAIMFERALDAQSPSLAMPFYRGDLLDGFFIAEAPDFERWLDDERRRLRQRAVAGAWALADARVAAADAEGARLWARRASGLAGLDDAAVRRHMRLLESLGDRTAALKEYEEFARRFAKEYEQQPSVETTALFTMLRQRNDLVDSVPSASRRPAESQILREHAPSAAVESPTYRRWLPHTLGALGLALVSTYMVAQRSFRAASHDARAAMPTKDLEAYNAYLRGREYLRRPSTAQNLRAAIQSLSQAVRRDDRFALAHTWLGQANTDAHWVAGLDAALMDSAKVSLARALQLDPDLPDAHANLAHYYYVCCEDYERALYHLSIAIAKAPDDARLLMFFGNVHKRRGQLEEAIQYYKRAARLDPLYRWPMNNLGHAQLFARRYDDAEKTFREVLAREPQDLFAYSHLALLLVLRDGDVAGARRIVQEAARSSEGAREMRLPYYLALVGRQYGEALARLQKTELGPNATLLNEWLVNDHIRGALAHRLRGDSMAARLGFDSTRMELERALGSTLRSSRRTRLRLRSGLAIAYAGVGRPRDAAAQVDSVLSSKPLEVDAIEGPNYLRHAALALVMNGSEDAATAILEGLLQAPGPVSLQSLRLEPLWDPLRASERFARLGRARSF